MISGTLLSIVVYKLMPYLTFSLGLRMTRQLIRTFALLFTQASLMMIFDDIRLLAVERFKTLDIDSDKEFREFVEMASAICNTPIALITLL